ncbi:Lysophospholipase [Rhodomicrobium vannielii ATCC 17100]|uniref:Lysophospholipase n=1 Tax=Rhodomicrobium vannielii (strain ATCC 17100 / DSM 162 / LMG 4299 / NCIMB 10020 / ATH 3.1.1) TaxID=648757 RepID=E3I7K9_RHOVT|nr:alpha/beta hydrolase [Rhodomicrobium vannielii]ADP69625.1 Lysophospholipase [Rhodomicrobium vannielii ATCC 17100]
MIGSDMATHGVSPAAELIGITRNPVPGGAICGTFASRDGLQIRYARWDTTAERRIGTVCLFHGRTEFIEKYFETIGDLRRRGFAVATMDWRGQGGSSRMLKNRSKGHAENFAQFDDDVRRFMSSIVLPDCPPPYYCLAHSMGGHLVLRLAQTKVCWWDRIVLTAPMIDFAQTEKRKGLIGLGAEVLTLLGFGDSFIPGGKAQLWERAPFDGNPLTSDRLRYERAQDVLRASPGLGIGAPTIGWVQAACASVATLASTAFMESIRVPTLIVAASNDQIVSNTAMERFASHVKNCRLIVVSGARHEILMERDQLRDQFWAAFDAYVPGSTLLPRRLEQPEIAL